jgi:hypothetical protein
VESFTNTSTPLSCPDAILGRYKVVKKRLGHGSIAATEKYLHTLPNADETAIAALARMRNTPR